MYDGEAFDNIEKIIEGIRRRSRSFDNEEEDQSILVLIIFSSYCIGNIAGYKEIAVVDCQIPFLLQKSI
jgi:hypothetical protein